VPDRSLLVIQRLARLKLNDAKSTDTSGRTASVALNNCSKQTSISWSSFCSRFDVRIAHLSPQSTVEQRQGVRCSRIARTLSLSLSLSFAVTLFSSVVLLLLCRPSIRPPSLPQLFLSSSSAPPPLARNRISRSAMSK
jgi:hypothetical protein